MSYNAGILFSIGLVVSCCLTIPVWAQTIPTEGACRSTESIGWLGSSPYQSSSLQQNAGDVLENFIGLEFRATPLPYRWKFFTAHYVKQYTVSNGDGIWWSGQSWINPGTTFDETNFPPNQWLAFCVTGVLPAGVATVIVGGDGTFDFQSTAYTIDFVGVNTVQFVDTTMVSVSYYDQPPSATTGVTHNTVFEHRWEVHIREGLTFDPATEIRIALDELSNPGFTDPSGVVAYRRSEPGFGTFIPVATSYDVSENELVLTGVAGMGEFLLAADVNLPTDIKVFLAGPFDAGTMHTDLQSGMHIPLSHPFAGAPWNYEGTETVQAVPENVVDWVLVHLRSAPNAASTVAGRAGFLLSNGFIRDLDGSSSLVFEAVPAGEYYIVVEHRNHAGVMTVAPVPLTESTTAAYDFTVSLGQAYGTQPMRNIDGDFVLWGGDGTSDGAITAFDFLSVWLQQNGSSPGYHQGDFNLSGGVTAFDYLNVWLPANGQASQIP